MKKFCFVFLFTLAVWGQVSAESNQQETTLMFGVGDRSTMMFMMAEPFHGPDTKILANGKTPFYIKVPQGRYFFRFADPFNKWGTEFSLYASGPPQFWEIYVGHRRKRRGCIIGGFISLFASASFLGGGIAIGEEPWMYAASGIFGLGTIGMFIAARFFRPRAVLVEESDLSNPEDF